MVEVDYLTQRILFCGVIMVNLKILNMFANDMTEYDNPNIGSGYEMLFELVEKPATIYAGKILYPDKEDDNWFADYEKNVLKLNDAVETDWMICMNIEDDAPSRYLWCREVMTDNQPEEVDWYKVPASLYIRLRKNDHNVLKYVEKECCYQTSDLYPIIYDFIEKHGFRAVQKGVKEIECNYAKNMDLAYAYVAIECI